MEDDYTAFDAALGRYWDTVRQSPINPEVRQANIEMSKKEGREFLRIMKGVNNVQKAESDRDRCESINS